MYVLSSKVTIDLSTDLVPQSRELRHGHSMSLIPIITSLAKEVMAKEVMFLVALISLSVCLSVDITQKVMNGFG